MSSQKGNLSRSRPQKFTNSRAFKNDLHDTTPRTKFLNSLDIKDVCPRCKDVLDWRIKYRKYKLLKNPHCCVKCSQRTVTKSYRIMCAECADRLKVCPKCGLNEAEQKFEAAKHHNDNGKGRKAEIADDLDDDEDPDEN